MSIRQISVFVENTPGALNAMTEVLAKHSIDMRALSLAETKDFGIVRMIVDDVSAAAAVLKEEGYVHSITPVLGAAIPDAPGGLNQVLGILSGNGVNIEYMYAFLGGRKADHAYMIFRVEDPDAGAEVLEREGVEVVQQSDFGSR